MSELKVVQRIVSNIVIDTDSKCWIWLGNKDSYGYGTYFYNGGNHCLLEEQIPKTFLVLLTS